MDPTAYPLSMLVFAPIVPFLMIGILLLGLATLKARALSKSVGIITLVMLAVLLISFPLMHLRVFAISFGYIYLLFGMYGGVLAFEKPVAPKASKQEFAA